MCCILFCFVFFLKPFIVLLSSSALWDWILSGLSPCFCLCRITSLLLPPWFQCPPSLPPQPLTGPEARCPSRDELWVTEYFQISVLDLSSATDLPYWGHLCLSYVSTMPRILPSVSPSAFRSPAPKARLCLLWCVSNILSHFLLMTLGLLQASISLQRDRYSIPPFHCLAQFPFSTPTFRVSVFCSWLYTWCLPGFCVELFRTPASLWLYQWLCLANEYSQSLREWTFLCPLTLQSFHSQGIPECASHSYLCRPWS